MSAPRNSFTLIGNNISDNMGGGLIISANSAVSNVTLSGNTISFNSPDALFPRAQIQVGGLGNVHFESAGTLSNTVLELPGDPDFLYESGPSDGFIFINDFLHPAAIDLP